MLRLDPELFITRRNLIDLRTSQVMRLLMVILVKINRSNTKVITMMISLRIPVSLDLEDIELELLPKDQIRSKLFKLVHKHWNLLNMKNQVSISATVIKLMIRNFTMQPIQKTLLLKTLASAAAEMPEVKSECLLFSSILNLIPGSRVSQSRKSTQLTKLVKTGHLSSKWPKTKFPSPPPSSRPPMTWCTQSTRTTWICLSRLAFTEKENYPLF